MKDGRFARFLVAVTVPLAVVAGAYSLWWISDRLLSIGPFDRAAFGWVVVVPVWLCTPITAGLAWRSLTPQVTAAASVTFGSIVSGVAAILFWRSVADPGFDYGAVRTPAEWILPSLVLGLVVGGGMAACGLLCVAIVRRGHPWRATLVGAAAAFLLIFVAILVFVLVTPALGCQRPSI